jgi:hypothetical protein
VPHIPEIVWIALAIPTIGSIGFALALIGAVAIRDRRWRARQRKRPPIVVLYPRRNGGISRLEGGSYAKRPDRPKRPG